MFGGAEFIRIQVINTVFLTRHRFYDESHLKSMFQSKDVSLAWLGDDIGMLFNSFLKTN